MNRAHYRLAALVLSVGLATACQKTTSPPPTTTNEVQTAPTPTVPTTGNQSPDKKPTQGGTDKSPRIEIVKGKVTINGTAVTLRTGKQSEFEKVLGKASRTSESGVFGAVYWRDLGIKCLHDKTGPDPNIVQIGCYFAGYYDIDQNHSSKEFPGSIVLEGESITRDTKIEELTKKISALKKSDETTWKIEYEDHTGVVLNLVAGMIKEVVVGKLRK